MARNYADHFNPGGEIAGHRAQRVTMFRQLEELMKILVTDSRTSISLHQAEQWTSSIDFLAYQLRGLDDYPDDLQRLDLNGQTFTQLLLHHDARRTEVAGKRIHP